MKDNLFERASKHLLISRDAINIDLKNSHGSWLVDIMGKERLDCFSQYASQPLGWNHPDVLLNNKRITDVSLHTIANSDSLTEEYCQFIETFASMTPDFKYHFYVAGGSLAVENSLKAAFDFKCKKLGWGNKECNNLNIVHLENAFHGRSGYALSLLSSFDKRKTDLYPMFDWTRIANPSFHEEQSLKEAEQAFEKGNVAAFIMETIQGEGGDNHIAKSFFEKVRILCDDYDVLFIMDEIQTGMLTGRTWAYEHFGIIPDMICFGKKVQTCGFCSTERIDEVTDNVFKVPSRISSTFGDYLSNMVRSTIYMEIIKKDNLINQTAKIGTYFYNKLKNLNLSNLRGRGLMIAFDLDNACERDLFLMKLSDKMLAIKCGSKSVRLRPHLTFGIEEADIATDFINSCL